MNQKRTDRIIRKEERETVKRESASERRKWMLTGDAPSMARAAEAVLLRLEAIVARIDGRKREVRAARLGDFKLRQRCDRPNP